MKKLTTTLLLFMCIFISVDTNAQKQTAKKTIKEVVKVIQTNHRGVAIMSNYFNPTVSKKILTQISPATFALVKKYCNESSYPACILSLLEYNPAKPDEDASEITLKNLELYRIATFDNIQNGTNFGEQSILVAPAKENKNIGGDCNYDKDFYIIIPTKDIEIVK